MSLLRSNHRATSNWRIQIPAKFKFCPSDRILAISDMDEPIMRIYRNSEYFRIYDGVSEGKSDAYAVFQEPNPKQRELDFNHLYWSFSEELTVAKDGLLPLSMHFRKTLQAQYPSAPSKIELTLVDRGNSLELWSTECLDELNCHYKKYKKETADLDFVEKTARQIQYHERPKIQFAVTLAQLGP